MPTTARQRFASTRLYFSRAYGEQIMALLGTVDFRKSWFGGLSLLVEEEVTRRFSGKVKRRWRRATLMDLAQPELRILIDMRSHPYVSPRTPLRPVTSHEPARAPL